MNTTELQKLIDHLFWADMRIWNVVLANSASKSNTKIREALFHSHMTQDAFFHVWTDTPFDIPKNESYDNIEAVKKYADKVSTQLSDYFENLSELKLEEKIEIPWSKYFVKTTGKEAASTTLLDTLMQVIMHTTYHRGQINKSLRELEIDPLIVDYIAWLWMDKPKAETP